MRSIDFLIFNNIKSGEKMAGKRNLYAAQLVFNKTHMVIRTYGDTKRMNMVYVVCGHALALSMLFFLDF